MLTVVCRTREQMMHEKALLEAKFMLRPYSLIAGVNHYPYNWHQLEMNQLRASALYMVR